MDTMVVKMTENHSLEVENQTLLLPAILPDKLPSEVSCTDLKLAGGGSLSLCTVQT